MLAFSGVLFQDWKTDCYLGSIALGMLTMLYTDDEERIGLAETTVPARAAETRFATPGACFTAQIYRFAQIN